jgi:hypothetical protein
MNRMLVATLLAAMCAAHAGEPAAPAEEGEAGEGGAASTSGDAVLELSPVLIDTQDGAGATLGLEFLARGALVSWDLSTEDTGDDFDLEARLGDLRLEYEAQGAVTADSERNPKNLLDGTLNLSYYFQQSFGTFAGGGFVRYETDQSFDDKQSVYGVAVTYGKVNAPFKNDVFAVDVRRGQIDPTDDAERAAALGSTSLDKYYRTDLEVLYIHTLGWKDLVRSIEFNYRYFRESSPAASLEAAGLDRFRLITYRLGLPQDLFIAYSTGTLPFDRQSDRIFEVGLTYKLQ